MSDRRETRIGDRIENRQKSLRRDRVERTHDAIGREHRSARRIEGNAAGRQASIVGTEQAVQQITVAALNAPGCSGVLAMPGISDSPIPAYDGRATPE
jgi:hypothetical protein